MSFYRDKTALICIIRLNIRRIKYYLKSHPETNKIDGIVQEIAIVCINIGIYRLNFEYEV